MSTKKILTGNNKIDARGVCFKSLHFSEHVQIVAYELDHENKEKRRPPKMG